MRAIHALASGLPVAALVMEIHRHPELWNQHRERTDQYAHSSIDDIWIRYNDYANFNGSLKDFNDAHDSVWYPAVQALPSLRPLVLSVMSIVGGERLGGVLITRIPPGGEVKPHIDQGWHASYYDKYAVQLESAPGQAFNFEGEKLEPRPGDLYWFDNSKLHWVTNQSECDRMTLIICIKTGERVCRGV